VLVLEWSRISSLFAFSQQPSVVLGDRVALVLAFNVIGLHEILNLGSRDITTSLNSIEATIDRRVHFQTVFHWRVVSGRCGSVSTEMSLFHAGMNHIISLISGDSERGCLLYRHFSVVVLLFKHRSEVLR